MKDYNILNGKRILIVDDEADVLDTLMELLPTCNVTRATTFQHAKALLETRDYDLAILDVMGVDGYELLKIANERKTLAIILTAHAFSPENTVRAYQKGAAFFVPKEKLVDITEFMGYVFSAKEKGGNCWSKWLESFEPIYDAKFGPAWKESDSEFWDALVTREWRLASTLREAERLI